MENRRVLQGASIDVAAKGELPLKLTLCACFILCQASSFVMPLIGSSLVQGFGLSEADFGYVSSAELGAIAFGSFALARVAHRIRPDLVAAAALVVMFAGNLICLLTRSTGWFVADRMAIGLAEGTLQAVVYIVAARTAQPHATFSLMYTLLSVYTMIIFLCMPAVQSYGGAGAPILLLAFSALAGLVVYRFLPGELGGLNARTPSAGQGLRQTGRLLGNTGNLAVLVGFCLFQLGQNGMWAYSALIATHLGISYSALNIIFAISALACIFVSAAAGWMAPFTGLFAPIVGSILLSAASIFYYPRLPGTLAFGMVNVVFSASLLYISSFVNTLVARMDESGRLSGLLSGFVAVGMALGPLVSSFALDAFGNYQSVALANTALTILAVAFIGPVAFNVDRRSRKNLSENRLCRDW